MGSSTFSPVGLVSLLVLLLAASTTAFLQPALVAKTVAQAGTARRGRGGARKQVVALSQSPLDSIEGEAVRPEIAAQLKELSDAAKARIGEMVTDNKVFLFMKGNPMFPQCGFSNTAVQVLRALDVEFKSFDVLSDPDVRQGVKDYSAWPTIPQLYVGGEFLGGSDILIEMFENGELKATMEEAGCVFLDKSA